jgi:hypothetical protein
LLEQSFQGRENRLLTLVAGRSRGAASARYTGLTGGGHEQLVYTVSSFSTHR